MYAGWGLFYRVSRLHHLTASVLFRAAKGARYAGSGFEAQVVKDFYKRNGCHHCGKRGGDGYTVIAVIWILLPSAQREMNPSAFCTVVVQDCGPYAAERPYSW